MQHLTIEQLTAVTGGEDSGDISGQSLFDAVTASPSSSLNPVVGPPGTQYFENDHSGPSTGQRVDNAFDRSTRVMRTFNDTFGWSAKKPGMGR